MKIVISSDEHTDLINCLLEDLRQRGHITEYLGPKAGESPYDWPEITLKAVERVIQKQADEAIILCWTGTGCSLVANKIPGIRAALCHDNETAKGARIWNHANVLALSLRTTSPAIAKEILDSWFGTPLSQDAWNLKQIARIEMIERKYNNEN